MLETKLLTHLQAAAFPRPEDIIHLFIGGSELHGAKVGTTDDLDLYGIYLERPEEALGPDANPHFVWSTAQDDRRNGPDDVDVTLYSLRRWAELAAKGNATALHFLFADATAVSAPAWKQVQDASSLFLARHSADQFFGFAENQRKRITGEAGRGTHGRRPEYECIHGYDSKAAMHCLRLYFECIELIQNGKITLPRPERNFLIEVRQGTLTLEDFSRKADELRGLAEQAAIMSSLPPLVNRKAISALIADVHIHAWSKE